MRSISGLVLALVLVAGLSACGESKRAGGSTVVSPVATSQLASIVAARASSSNFAIFPLNPSSVACVIPRGGPYVPGKMHLDGTCSTEVRPFHPSKGIHGGHGTVGIVTVVFTEQWRFPATSRSWRSSWLVNVRHGHVLTADTRLVGPAPPQTWF